MKKLCLFFVIASLSCAHTSFAQLVGQTAFLQGTWLQAAIAPNGSWGNSTNPPAGYFTRGGASANYVDPITGSAPTFGLDFSYDQGHDGFATGATPWYGSFFLPGTPYVGWEVQFNGIMGSANYTDSWKGGYDTTLGGNFNGAVSYKGPDCVNPKMAPQGIWDGHYGHPAGNLRDALHIVAVNEVDDKASWLNVTVKFYNTTDSLLHDVYYWASGDPDNDFPINSNFATNNHIAYQGGPLDRHEVWGRATTAGFNDLFSGLATQDCRAKVLIYQWWPASMTAGNTLDKVYAGTSTGMGTCWYPVGSTTFSQDIAYAMVFNVGNIPPHDSAYITYAWIFADTNSIDSIYQLKPQLSTEGKQYYSYQKDSVLACTMAGCQVYGDSLFEAHIINGENRDWALSTWTWAPSTGLSTTVGRDVLVDIRKLGGTTTYTITGVPNPTRGSCLPTAPLQFILYVQPCFNAWNTSPCYGSKLLFGMSGDSIGATYAWSGPKGWTATGHHPFKDPALYTDTGWYRVIKTIGTLHDTDSTHVVIHEKPVLIVTNNSPMCSNDPTAILKLSATPLIPGETFAWTGPNGFTGVGQFPTVNPFIPVDTGMYNVIATTPFGCKDTGQVYARMVPPPDSPIISGTQVYCQNEPFTGLTAVPRPPATTGTIKWYTSSTGGVGSLTAPTLSTVTPGYQTVWASNTNSFGCEGERATYTILVKPTPPIPGFTGGLLEYCQHVGTFVPVIPTPVPGGKIHWWKASTGGTYDTVQPVVDLNVAGVFTCYISQNLDGCEGPRGPLVVTVHPKPAPPTIKSDSICQFFPAKAMVATPSISGDLIRWFIGSGDTIGTLTAPVPVTLVPGLQDFFANELSPFGCLSDKAKGTLYVKPKPMEPVTRDTMWCQFTQVKPLTADSIFGGNLRWYIDGITQANAPVPYNTIPGDSTYYVANVVNGCVSDSVPLKVTVIYKPVFAIEAGSPFVCQFDSVKFAYKGPSIFDPKYSWSIPEGASYAINGETGRSLASDSTIYVRFDSVTQNNYIHLHVTNNGGFCSNDTSVRIKIVPQPYGKAQTKGDVCQGDTVILALGAKSASAANFKWYIDNVLMDQTNALSIVAHDNNSGGPFSITWNDSGRHVIQVRSTTIEGCTSLPTEDTIKVHTKPDAVFSYAAKSGLCLEDSVLFVARDNDYRNAYTWLPEHSFSNVNKREIYGRVEQTVSIITLQVTDPFGCTASTSQTLNSSTCCVVGFPTAFTPNGDGKNDVFRPIYNGYHRFHEFRIANRWGQTVFESTNSDMSWNGNFNGVPQDMGVYFYYIKYDCGGKSIEKTGDVTLVR